MGILVTEAGCRHEESRKVRGGWHQDRCKLIKVSSSFPRELPVKTSDVRVQLTHMAWINIVPSFFETLLKEIS
jgi:hypothetical protein